jgi:hypothetical protein
MPIYIGPWQEMKLARMIASCQRRQQFINTSRFSHHADVEHSDKPTKTHNKRSQRNTAIPCKSDTSTAPLRPKQKVKEALMQKEDLREFGDFNSKASVRCYESYDLRQSCNSDKNGKKYIDTPPSCSTGKKDKMGKRRKSQSQHNQIKRVNQVRQIYVNPSASEQLYGRNGSKVTERIKESYPLPPEQDYPTSRSPSRESLTTLDFVKCVNISSDENNPIENADQLILWADSLSFEGL